MADVRDELARIGEVVRERFEAQKRVLTFEEYLELCRAHPERHCRDASRYLRDCLDHYGSYEIERAWGRERRFRLFDLPFEPREGRGRRRDHLVGHEAIQGAFYQVLSNFVREGRSNRLILLHGPNGSAKSTFALTLMRGLEHYSTTDEGALYRFSWVFPRGRDGKAIGFGSTDAGAPAGRSYAHLPDGQLDVKLPSEVREHPLLLLPTGERRGLVEKLLQGNGDGDPPADWIWNGLLSDKNQKIYEALLTAYRGDVGKVLNHVQVERYYISRRYRVGAVTIGPQMAVDASERQITADRTLSSLPASLSALTLYEPYGELVDASGGIIEYSDLLKRPLDAWKYLLLAIETGEVSLPLSNLQLNSVLLSSSNEVHLNAFKEHHEYASFRGRLSLLRVPYLLDYRQEQAIYDAQIVPQVRTHVAPHATWVAALWAVLTRLRRPQADRYDRAPLGRVAADLTPMEKALLYAGAEIPERLSTEDSRELASGIEAIYRECETAADYEGLTGASPREVRTLLLDAANDPRFACLSPVALFDRLDAFCKRGDHQFLKQTPDRGYQDHRGFVRQIHERWLDKVDDEVRSCTGLVEEGKHRELFDVYVLHVSYWVKNERVYNPITGKTEDPDSDLMRSIEDKLEASEGREEFRRNLISAIAAYAIDHPGEKVDYARLFPRYVDRLEESYYGEHRKQVGAIARDMLRVLDDAPGLEAEGRAAAQRTLERMIATHGYEASSARAAIGELVRERYPS